MCGAAGPRSWEAAVASGPTGAALHHLERLVHVDLDLGAIRLRDLDLIAVTGEVGRHVAGLAAGADALLRGGLGLRGGVAGYGLLGCLMCGAAGPGPGEAVTAAAATGAALQHRERLVEVDLHLRAVGLRDLDLIAVAGEVGRHVA